MSAKEETEQNNQYDDECLYWPLRAAPAENKGKGKAVDLPEKEDSDSEMEEDDSKVRRHGIWH